MRTNGTGAVTRRKRDGRTSRKRVVLMAYAIWVAAVLLTSVPYLAETGTRKVVDDGEYTYSPTFPHDGDIEHYEVERADSSENASIFLEYHAAQKTVDIEAVNIAELTVDCKSVARKHSVELTNDEYADMQIVHQYFYDMGHIVVNTDVTDTEGMTITWKDMPVPTAVVADSAEYTEPWATSGNIQVDVPEGEHQYILYFTGAPEFPKAVIKVDRLVIVKGMEVEFDGSDSIAGEGPQGAIQDYIWDIDTSDAELTDSDDMKFKHTYTKSGTYNVSLTVRNGYWLKHTAWVDIKVKNSDPDIDLDGDGIPNEEDDDIDGDAVINDDDDFPLDAAAHKDTDKDGKPDNLTGVSTTGLIEDLDDDNDSVPDTEDKDPLDATVGRISEGGEEEEDNMLIPILIIVMILIVVVIVAAVAMARSKAAKQKAAEEAAAQQAAAAAAAQQAAAEQAAAEAAAQQAAAQQAAMPPAEGYDDYGGYDAYGGAEGAALAAEEAPALTEGEMPPGEMEFGPDAAAAAEAPAEMGRDEYMASVDTVAMEEYGFSEEELSSLHEAIDETVAADAAAPAVEAAEAAEAAEVVDAAEVATEVPPQQ